MISKEIEVEVNEVRVSLGKCEVRYEGKKIRNIILGKDGRVER